MATSRPSNFPEWDINEIDITQPDTTRRSGGWQVSGTTPEKPPYQYDNYQQNLVYKWVKSFEEDGGTPKFYASDTGAVNVLEIEIDAVSSLQDGISIFFQTPNANTGAATLTIGALTTKPIVVDNVALVGGEIAANTPYLVVYSFANDNFELKSMGTSIDKATAAEIRIGTDDNKYVTSLGINDTILGMSQTWQNVIGSRTSGVIYTNSTGKPILVTVSSQGTSASNLNTFINEIKVSEQGIFSAVSVENTTTIIVPVGDTYRFNSPNLSFWFELR